MRFSRIEFRRLEGFLFLLFNGLFLYPLIHVMGTKNFLSTIFATAHDLLLNTCFYLMAITVLAGSLGQLLIEFGVMRLIEMIFSPFMRPLFNLPGVASLGALLTFFSDNPAIIGLAKDKNFNRYFHTYQILSLTNYGTAFGMGLIVITFMVGKGYGTASLIGLAGAVVGAIVSTRLMQRFTIKEFPPTALEKIGDEEKIIFRKHGSYFERFLNALLDGGKNGVDLGLAIIPGVLVISTFMMVMTFGVKDPSVGYQGIAYEGVPLLTKIGEWLYVPFHFLFGFKSPELISFPVTSLGSVGAALSLIPTYIKHGIITGNEIAVFTAIGMCWSGYLSTHSAMLDSLGYRRLTGKAIFSHTVGGLMGGVAAHYFYLAATLFL